MIAPHHNAVNDDDIESEMVSRVKILDGGLLKIMSSFRLTQKNARKKPERQTKTEKVPNSLRHLHIDKMFTVFDFGFDRLATLYTTGNRIENRKL